MFILANLEKTIKTYTQKIIAYILLNNLTPFEIQVLSTSAIKCRSKFRIFQFASAMCQQKKNCRKLIRNLCISCRQWLRRTSACYEGLWFFLTADTTYSAYIILFTYNTCKRVKQKATFLLLITLFWFLCVSLL